MKQWVQSCGDHGGRSRTAGAHLRGNAWCLRKVLKRRSKHASLPTCKVTRLSFMDPNRWKTIVIDDAGTFLVPSRKQKRNWKLLRAHGA